MSVNQPFLTLIGGGAYARELISWIDHAHTAGRCPPVKAFLDDSSDALASFDYGLEHRGRLEDYAPADQESLVVAISDPIAKQAVVARLLTKGARFATVVHPSAVIARTARLGQGVTICPLALVSADAVVGDFATINTMSSVGHDVRLGAYSTLSSHVDLTGRVHVGEGCFFGSGARALPGIKIGDRARIGAGAVVMRNVKAETVMYAPPAKKL